MNLAQWNHAICYTPLYTPDVPVFGELIRKFDPFDEVNPTVGVYLPCEIVVKKMPNHVKL
jgi:hypothetical protein